MNGRWSRIVRPPVVALTLVAAITGFDAGASADPGADKPPDAGRSHTVTLITGDRVTLLRSGAYTVAPGPGRANVNFFASRVAGRLRVIPSDAAILARSGRLDDRLFDVTGLVEGGFDDRRTTLPLIIGTGESATALTRARSGVSTDASFRIRTLPNIHMVTVEQRRAKAVAFWKSITGGNSQVRTLGDGISRVWLDGTRRPLLDQSVQRIGAPAAWRAGYTGEGVTVAVLDSGVDTTHPDLAGRVVAFKNFTGDVEGDGDRAGHGTHVVSTIAGSGAASAGRYRGVAPGADIAVGKVCVRGGCSESWILEGMRWAAEERRAKVINMSLGGSDGPGLDPLEQAVETLTARTGVLFVASAGNDGASGRMSSPASAPSALAVGAVNDFDDLARFSSRGPRLGDDALKPDITAPGVKITAARGQDSRRPGDSYTAMSGTSMAAPHVAGAAALLVQAHPDWTWQRIKATLMASASPNPALDVYAQGAGRVDVAAALSARVVTDPPSVSFGRPRYPHDDDHPIAVPVTYHNTGSTAVTLDLTLPATAGATAAEAGTPAPAGMFRVSPSTVTVPAGGTTSVVVTADTSVTGPDGYAGGYITATGDGVTLRTPVAVHKEVESYDVAFLHLDRLGEATENFVTFLTGLDGATWFTPYHSENGVATLRIPKGTYVLDSFIWERGGGSTFLAQPRLTVIADGAITIDARIGEEIRIGVNAPESAVANAAMSVGWAQRTEAGTISGDVFSGGGGRLFTGQLGTSTEPVPGFASRVIGVWGDRSSSGVVSTDQRGVNLAFFVDGRMSLGLVRDVDLADLAIVRAEYGSAAAGSDGTSFVVPKRPGQDPSGAVSVTVPLPSRRTEYYNTDGGLEWILATQEVFEDEPISLVEWPSQRFEPGHTYQVAHNMGVFGPTLASAPVAWRVGDTVSARIPLFGDGAGHRGDSAVRDFKSELSPDGAAVGEDEGPGLGDFIVPADARRYELTLSARRDKLFELSTRVEAVWRFESARTEEVTPLPLWTVGFTPRLDGTNTALADQELTVPLRVESQPGASVGTLDRIGVEVSLDDGATWSPVPVTSVDGSRSVAIRHPGGSGFVSLRASVTDSDGNTVDETIIRAYRYAPAR